MSKKTIIIIIAAVIVLAGGIYFFINNYKNKNGCLVFQGYSWCAFQNKCIKKTDNCSLTTDWLIKEAKKIIGLDINIMGKAIKWNTEKGELILDAKGWYYLDVLKAEKAIKGFADLDNFFKQNNFDSDSYNPSVNSGEKDLRTYKKDKIVCQLSRIDNSGNTTSLSFFCAYENDTMCDFKANCGRECKTDNDCVIFGDGCAKRIVCRNKNYKFYSNCANPTSNINELDVDIVNCKCSDNQCVPKNDKLRNKN